MNIRITNLSRKITEVELEELFKVYGDVSSVTIVMDPKTKMSKGFAFVEMKNMSEVKKAVSGLNKTKVKGERITVKVVK